MFPLKVVWLPLPRNDQQSPARMIVSVPKKRIPHAVDRNRLKRLIREAWRLHKQLLYTQIPAEKQYHIFFIFTGQIHTDFQTIETVIMKAIAKINDSKNKETDA